MTNIKQIEVKKKQSVWTGEWASDQVTQLSEVPTHRVEDSQQDVDVGWIKLCRIRGVTVLGQNPMELSCKQEQRIKSKKEKRIKKEGWSDSLPAAEFIWSCVRFFSTVTAESVTGTYLTPHTTPIGDGNLRHWSDWLSLARWMSEDFGVRVWEVALAWLTWEQFYLCCSRGSGAAGARSSRCLVWTGPRRFRWAGPQWRCPPPEDDTDDLWQAEIWNRRGSTVLVNVLHVHVNQPPNYETPHFCQHTDDVWLSPQKNTNTVAQLPSRLSLKSLWAPASLPSKVPSERNLHAPFKVIHHQSVSPPASSSSRSDSNKVPHTIARTKSSLHFLTSSWRRRRAGRRLASASLRTSAFSITWERVCINMRVFLFIVLHLWASEWRRKNLFFLATFKVAFSFFFTNAFTANHFIPASQSDMTCVNFVCGVNWHDTHNVARLLGRRLWALLPEDAHKVRQGGAAGEQRGGLGSKKREQHLFKQQRRRNAFDAADRGVGQLQRGGAKPIRRGWDVYFKGFPQLWCR